MKYHQRIEERCLIVESELTEAQFRAVERRLGHPLDPYRPGTDLYVLELDRDFPFRRVADFLKRIGARFRYHVERVYEPEGQRLSGTRATP